MKIKYSPQRAETKINYTFQEDIIIVECNGVIEEFDFTECPNGALKSIEVEDLEINPIIGAERIEGELKVELLYFCSANATHEELFPQWHNPLEEVEEIENPVEE